MKKSEMVCKNCIKYGMDPGGGYRCHAYPIPEYVWYGAPTHWCAKGQWHDGDVNDEGGPLWS